MGFLLSKLLPLLLYPLGLGLLLQLLGLAAASKGSEQGSRRRRQASLWLSGTGVGLIWLCAMPLSSRQLIWGLEDRAAACGRPCHPARVSKWRKGATGCCAACNWCAGAWLPCW